jgi:hypothetical protein
VVANTGETTATPDVSVLWNNCDGSGTFEPAVHYLAGLFCEGVDVADFDNDGRTDIAVANSGSHSLSILRNLGGRSFVEVVELSTGIHPTSLASSDFDLDGDIDLASANSFSALPGVSVLLNTSAALSEDCNLNRIPDECDIESGFSEDCNLNGNPDECDIKTYNIVELVPPLSLPPEWPPEFVHVIPWGMNDAGEIVGVVTSDPAIQAPGRPFYWHDGVWTILPGFPGGNPAQRATFINNFGRICGDVVPVPPEIGSGYSIYWERDAQGQWQPNPLFAPGQTSGAGYTLTYGINDLGFIVGGANFEDGFGFRAYRWSETGVCVVSPGPSDNDRALSINDLGQIAVHRFWGTLPGYLFTPDSPNSCMGVLTTLPTLGGTGSLPWALNNLGVVCGDSKTSTGDNHAVVWIPLEANGTSIASMLDLGTLGGPDSLASDIRDTEDLSTHFIVGNSTTPAGQRRAVLWMVNGSSVELYDLNSLIPPKSGWVLTHASKINSGGQILGWGLHNGVTHGFLLVPSGDCNKNGIPDECDIANCVGDPACADCNGNGVPDGCDIANCPPEDPTCQDCDADGVMNGCEPVGGYCELDADCDDGLICTFEECDPTDCTCIYAVSDPCCEPTGACPCDIGCEN